MASAALHPLAGPERIESGWWDGRDAQRDYFIATRTDGSVVWVYRELDDSAVRWFVQGWFA
jgi:protein ImuB